MAGSQPPCRFTLSRAPHEANEEALVQVRRDAAGEDDGRSVLHQVLQAPGELPGLGRGYFGAVLVDLGLSPRHGVDDGRRGAGVSLYLDEVERDGRLSEAVADGVTVAPAGEPGGKYWHVQGPQGPGHVDALSTGQCHALRR